MNKKNHPINQHYVPRLLLKNFNSNDKESIWCFDKKEKKCFETNIDNIACERYFYDFEKGNPDKSIEYEIGKLETEASLIIKKVIKQESVIYITQEEKESLAFFIALQIIRTKNQLEKSQQFYNMINKISKDLTNKPIIEDEDILKESARISWLRLHESLKQLIPNLLNKKWYLIKSDGEFYISDNPVVKQNVYNKNEVRSTLGLSSIGIEIYLPISKNLVLGLLCNELYERIKESKANTTFISKVEKGCISNCLPEVLININSLQVIYSERFIFSSVSKFDLVKEIITSHPEIRQGPRLIANI